MNQLSPVESWQVEKADRQTTAIVKQATDTSFWNTDPLVGKAAVTGVVASVTLMLAAFGVVSEESRVTIIEQTGNIVFGFLTILPLIIAMVTAVWARVSVYSPRRAAGLAVVNAVQHPSDTPTLNASDSAIEAAVKQVR